MTTDEELQAIRHDLFEAVGKIGDLVDVLKAISISSRLAFEKLDKIGAALTRIAVRTGKPEEDAP
jgi:hypothetical protein